MERKNDTPNQSRGASLVMADPSAGDSANRRFNRWYPCQRFISAGRPDSGGTDQKGRAAQAVKRGENIVHVADSQRLSSPLVARHDLLLRVAP